MTAAGTLIVGAGQAGHTMALTLRRHGYAAPVTVVGAEPHQPYQRPPLSKAFLLGTTDVERLALGRPNVFPEAGIDLVLGERITSDRSRTSPINGRRYRRPSCSARPMSSAWPWADPTSSPRPGSILSSARGSPQIGAAPALSTAAAIEGLPARHDRCRAPGPGPTQRLPRGRDRSCPRREDHLDHRTGTGYAWPRGDRPRPGLRLRPGGARRGR